MKTVFTTKRVERNRVEMTMTIKSPTGAVMAVYSKKYHETVPVSEACRDLMTYAEEWEFPSTQSEYDCSCEQCAGSDYG